MEQERVGTTRPGARGFGLSRDAWGRLILIDAEGRRYVGVEPVRGFPISDPHRWVTLCDAEGHEVVHVEDLADLPQPARQALEEELAEREFVPLILQIRRVAPDSIPSDWDVVTDRGATRFSLDSADAVRQLGSHRVMITDSHGIRYQVPDLRTLEAASRRLLERFL